MNTDQVSELFHLYDKLNNPLGYYGNDEPGHFIGSATGAANALTWLRKPQVSVPAVLLLAILIFLAACQTASSITTEDLTGRWRTRGGAYIITFNEDGTYKVGTSEFGPFQLDGTLLTMDTAEGAPRCSGKRGIYELGLTEKGKLHWTLIEDECENRGRYADNSVWSSLAP